MKTYSTEDMQHAARAIGFNLIIKRGLNDGKCFEIHDRLGNPVRINWQPLTNAEHSEELGLMLDIDCFALEGNAIRVECFRDEYITSKVSHNNTLEDKKRALHEARMECAIEIGKRIPTEGEEK